MKLYTDFPLGLMVDHILDVDRLELELVLLMTGTGWQDAGIDTGTLRTWEGAQASTKWFGKAQQDIEELREAIRDAGSTAHAWKCTSCIKKA